MRKRAMKWLAAIFASAVVGCTLTAISEAAVEPKDCLAAPNGQLAQGSHWFYRIDPATNRRCWYVRGDGQEAALTASSSMKPSDAPAGTALKRSIADARAEIAAAPDVLKPKTDHGPSTVTVASRVNDDIGNAGAPVFNAQSSIFAERGSDDSDTLAPADAAPSNVFAGVRHRPRSVSVKRIGHHAPRSVWMLLSALAGALALVGIATMLFTKLRSAIGRQHKRERKRVIWSTLPVDSISPVESRNETPMDWIRIARETQEISRQGEQIEQLLARVSRRSAV